MSFHGVGQLGTTRVLQIPKQYGPWWVSLEIKWESGQNFLSFFKSATWLYLTGAPVYGPQYDPLHRKVFGIDLRCVLLNDLVSSSLVILVSLILLLVIPFPKLLSAAASRSGQEQISPVSHNFKRPYQIILGRCPIYGSPCSFPSVTFWSSNIRVLQILITSISHLGAIPGRR